MESNSKAYESIGKVKLHTSPTKYDTIRSISSSSRNASLKSDQYILLLQMINMLSQQV